MNRDRSHTTAPYFQHDLSDISHISALIDSVEAEIVPITTLVNNACAPAKTRGDMLDVPPKTLIS